ncbi:hypothetical protein Q0F99_07685 [Rathayibacter oskolensis]|uniref:hypothetical protein n=1 Tax=Rathayibacter oskolensis TaxID=1891671 RepID=UPI00265F6163|nr:hypothetical protein [Rathayibacter oskolensis]WKK72777.1 hypothetical protein Q0F99_07685 [Rathayibacter oskolensis]
MTPALDAVDIRKSFTAARRGPVVDVLHGVSLAVAAGEMVSVVGPSGSGSRRCSTASPDSSARRRAP